MILVILMNHYRILILFSTIINIDLNEESIFFINEKRNNINMYILCFTENYNDIINFLSLYNFL